MAPACLPEVAESLLSGSAGAALRQLMGAEQLLVITGAGVSTESGIPDYRSPGRKEYKPLNHMQFISQEFTRRRYWARSTIGFKLMGSAAPNAAHLALAALEERGHVHNLITQNVDRLHHKAGHKSVLELHGTIHDVECLDCGHKLLRSSMQVMLTSLNGAWLNQWTGDAFQRPDGDVDLPEEAYRDFNVPPCPHCNGHMLKPCVVFHGGTVPAHVTERALQLARSCDGLLVCGSTVSTFSAFRLVRDVAARSKPVGILNYGPTRADDLASFKIPASVGGVLSAIVKQLSPAGGG